MCSIAQSISLLLCSLLATMQVRCENMTDDQLLAGAPERISRYRESALTVRVVHGDGKPVRDAKVTVEQLSHDFLFGCNLFMLNRLQPPELERQYRDRFAALFNYATLPFYWAGFEGEQGKPQYDRIDAWSNGARRRALRARGIRWCGTMWRVCPSGCPRTSARSGRCRTRG